MKLWAKMAGAVFAAAVILFTALVMGGENELEVKAVSPAAGLTIEKISSDDGAIDVYLAGWAGGPLPTENSLVLSFAPPPAKAVFAASIVPRDRHWSVPSWPKSLAEIPELTQYALWNENSQSFGCMINLTGGGMITYLAGKNGAIEVSAHSHMEGYSPKRVPMFAIGYGDDPYILTRELYTFALKTMREVDPEGVIGRVRWEKDFPEVMNNVGWCSWNAHYTDITAAGLAAHAARFKELNLPIRWMIIDDGWHTLVQTTPKGKKKRGMSLAAFEADPAKFPQGLAAAVKTVKEDYGIKWVGAWFTLHGYWNGIARNSEMGREYAGALLPVSDDVALPDPRSEAGQKFWDGWFTFLHGAGIDFVKTDDQSTGYEMTEGIIPVGDAYAGFQRNYQAAAGRHFDYNVINCMSMNVDTMYQWSETNIARVSRDFYPVEWHNPREHTVDCVMNSMWFGNLAWPDYDMWQTHDQYREYHAVARALSGGPVYITDKLGQERPEYLKPLILSDGRVLRVDEPGLPSRKSLFTNPYTSMKPLIAFARSGEAGLIGVWNVDRFERAMKASVSISTIEGIKGDRFAIYDYFSGALFDVSGGGGVFAKLKGWDVRLYIVVPIHDGFAPIGLKDKYVSPATVKDLEWTDEKISFTVLEPGRFLAWSGNALKSVFVNGATAEPSIVSYSDNRLEIDLTGVPGGEIKIELVR